MIATDLENIAHQVLITPSLQKAIAFLRRRDLLHLSDGRVELDGDRVFAIVQRYETAKTEAPTFECHRKYIDVQFIASGEEIIGWAPSDRMTVTEAYDSEKDICFGNIAPGAWTPICLHAGQLAVLWPEDSHAPKLSPGPPSPVMKIVVKIAV